MARHITHTHYMLYVCRSQTGVLSKRLQRIGLYYTVLTEIGYLYNKGIYFPQELCPKVWT